MIIRARIRHNKIKVVFTFQPFTNNVHMEQPQKANTHAKSKYWRVFWFELQGTITKAQFLNRILQIIVVFVANRKEPRINEWLNIFVARQHLICTSTLCCYRIAHSCLTCRLKIRYNIPDFTRGNITLSLHDWAQRSNLQCQAISIRRKHLDGVALPDHPINNTRIQNNATIIIIITIENECSCRSRNIPFRMRNALDHRLKHLINILTRLGANLNNLIFFAAQ